MTNDTTTPTTTGVVHSTFTLTRDLPVPPARVFRAFADPKEKATWFGGGEGWETTETALDFRVGGREIDEGVFNGETRSRFEAVYTDIVDDQRIILAYDMWVNGKHISTSVASHEFEATETGTRYTHTEHGIHLDAIDDGSQREEGTRELHDALEAYLTG